MADRYTIGPNATSSWQQRDEEGGLKWRLVASILSIAAAVPRIQMLHGYLQPKLEGYALDFSSLDSVMDLTSASSAPFGHSNALVGIALVGIITGITEFTALRYARPPKTQEDELAAIVEHCQEDAINIRMIAKFTKKSLSEKKASSFFTTKTAAMHLQRSTKEARAFRQVSDAWCLGFYNKPLSLVEAEKDVLTDKTAFITKATCIPALKASLAAASYTGAGNTLAAPLILHSIAAFSDVLKTSDHQTEYKKADLTQKKVKGQ